MTEKINNRPNFQSFFVPNFIIMNKKLSIDFLRLSQTGAFCFEIILARSKLFLPEANNS